MIKIWFKNEFEESGKEMDKRDAKLSKSLSIPNMYDRLRQEDSWQR